MLIVMTVERSYRPINDPINDRLDTEHLLYIDNLRLHHSVLYTSLFRQAAAKENKTA